MKTEKFAVRKNWPEKFLYTLRMGEASLTRGRSLTRSPTTPQVTYSMRKKYCAASKKC